MIIHNGKKRSRRSDISQFEMVVGAAIPNTAGSSAAQKTCVIWANTTTINNIIGVNVGAPDKQVGVKWRRIKLCASVSPDLTVDENSGYPMTYPSTVQWILFACSGKPAEFAAFNPRLRPGDLPDPDNAWSNSLISGSVDSDQVIAHGIEAVNPHRWVLNSNTLTPPIYEMTVAVAEGEGGGEFLTVQDISLSSYGNSFGGGDATNMTFEIDHCFNEPQLVTADCQLRLAVRVFAQGQTPDWYYDELQSAYGDPQCSVVVSGHVQVDYDE